MQNPVNTETIKAANVALQKWFKTCGFPAVTVLLFSGSAVWFVWSENNHLHDDLKAKDAAHVADLERNSKLLIDLTTAVNQSK